LTQPHIALLHYASPPGIGGVETTLYYHASGLAALGYPIRVISGAGAAFHPAVTTIADPLFGSHEPTVLAVKRALDCGGVPADFAPLVETISERLRAALDGCTVVLVHNIHTMNKNLPLTAALHTLGQPPSALHLIAWVHDLAWTNAQYAAELHPGWPWDLLRTAWPGTRYVTISEQRRAELSTLIGLPPDAIPIVPPGVDVAALQAWPPTVQRLANQLGWLDAGWLLLLPARLTRRKNIAQAIAVLGALRALTGGDDRLIVTGPPGPHNPANPGYLAELRQYRAALGLDHAVHFLYEQADPASPALPLLPDAVTLAALYRLADALLFPSEQEGFGMPLLEAGLAGLPIFCADLPVFRATGGGDIATFDPHGDPAAIAAQIERVLTGSAQARFKQTVRRTYRWSSLLRERVLPLLEVSPL